MRKCDRCKGEEWCTSKNTFSAWCKDMDKFRIFGKTFKESKKILNYQLYETGRYKIEGLGKCKQCNVVPEFEYADKYFRFVCPNCERNSSTDGIHGIETAINDWNRYHS